MKHAYGSQLPIYLAASMVGSLPALLMYTALGTTLSALHELLGGRIVLDAGSKVLLAAAFPVTLALMLGLSGTSVARLSEAREAGSSESGFSLVPHSLLHTHTAASVQAHDRVELL